MSINCKTDEITKTLKLHFDKPIFATHPDFPDQELAFTDASATLTAFWDKRSRSWKPKRDELGNLRKLELHAPKAKRVGYRGEVLRGDAFHINGKLTPKPIPLTSIVKKAWDDDTQDSIRRTILDEFWGALLTG